MAIQGWTSFTDDEENPETLTSTATTTVAPPTRTTSLDAVPASHEGSGTTFTFEVSFSEEPKSPFSYKTMRDHVFTVTGGSVKNVERKEQGSNIGWRVTFEPEGSGDMRAELPDTTDCTAEGAICTDDCRKLKNSLDFTPTGGNRLLTSTN